MQKRNLVLLFTLINSYQIIETKVENNLLAVDFHESMSRNKRYKKSFAINNNNWKKLINAFNEHIVKNPKYSEKPKIPKIIHQIWIGSPLPGKFKRLCKTWTKNHPDWEYKLWTDKDIEKFGLWNKKRYDEAKDYGEKANIVRYEILYRIGGLYVDTDFECLKPFDILHHICDFYTGSAYSSKAAMFNGLIASTAGHPVLEKCIDDVRLNKKDARNRFGVEFFYHSFFKVIDSHSGPSVVFPVTYFYPWPHYRRNQNSPKQIRKWVTPETLAIHHWAVSWRKKKKS